MPKSKPKDKPPAPKASDPATWAVKFLDGVANERNPKMNYAEALESLTQLKAQANAASRQGPRPKPKPRLVTEADGTTHPNYAARRYAELVGRPLEILMKVADGLKLTDAELGKLTRAFAARTAVHAAAGDFPHPYLDTCIGEALAAANGKPTDE